MVIGGHLVSGKCWVPDSKAFLWVWTTFSSPVTKECNCQPCSESGLKPSVHCYHNYIQGGFTDYQPSSESLCETGIYLLRPTHRGCSHISSRYLQGASCIPGLVCNKY